MKKVIITLLILCNTYVYSLTVNAVITSSGMKTEYISFQIRGPDGGYVNDINTTIPKGQTILDRSLLNKSGVSADYYNGYYVDLIDRNVYPYQLIKRFYLSDETPYRDENGLWRITIEAAVSGSIPDLPDLPDPIYPIPDPPEGGELVPIIPPGPPPGTEFPYNPPEYPDPPNYTPPVYPDPPVYDPPIYYPPVYPDPPEYPEFPGWPDPPEYPEYPDPPDYDDLTGELGNLIGLINDMIKNGGSNDGSQGDDGSGGTNATSGGNVFIKGIDQSVYGNLYAIEQSGTANALAARNLSAEEIALKIHDALLAAGLSAPEIKVSVQEVLSESGLSDYKIGLSVESAFGKSLDDFGVATDWGVAYAFNDALSRQCLDPISIAKEIGRVLESLGLEKDGIESAIDTVMRAWEPSSGKFQIAFESALNNKGLSSDNIGISAEIALANRNLSAAEIGLEVGNQIQGLGLSTKTNDDANTDRIVGAIEGLDFGSNDFSGIYAYFDEGEELVQGYYSTNIFNIEPEEEYDFDNNISNILVLRDDVSAQAETAKNTFNGFLEDVFDFSPPDIGKALIWEIDFSPAVQSLGFSRFAPMYEFDLTQLNGFRRMEIIAINIMTLFGVISIFKTVLSS